MYNILYHSDVFHTLLSSHTRTVTHLRPYVYIGVSVHIFLQFVTALGQKLKNHVFVKRGVCKSAFGLVYTIFSMLDHLYL